MVPTVVTASLRFALIVGLALLLALPVRPSAGEAKLEGQTAADPIETAPKVQLAGKVKDNAPVAPWDDRDPEEGNAYYHTLVLAHTTSAKAFANSARRDVTFAHLFEEPEKYRGEVIHFEGQRLKRVRALETPKDIRTAYDLPRFYEGWIFAQQYGANPVCVIFMVAPA